MLRDNDKMNLWLWYQEEGRERVPRFIPPMYRIRQKMMSSIYIYTLGLDVAVLQLSDITSLFFFSFIL
jgi:hypothetical protein